MSCVYILHPYLMSCDFPKATTPAYIHAQKNTGVTVSHALENFVEQFFN